MDDTGEHSRGASAAAESKQVDLPPSCQIQDEKAVGAEHVVIETDVRRKAGKRAKFTLAPVIAEAAGVHGRYGYRRVTALLRDAGWHVNRERVECIWSREGLKVPQRRPKRGRLWPAAIRVFTLATRLLSTADIQSTEP